jgi:putative cell wall-binding protein
VILGGTAVVSQAVANHIANNLGIPVIRLAGANRYETAVAISQEAFAGGADRVYVATGLNFPDALAGAAAAGTHAAPVLLVAGTGNQIPQGVELEIQRLGPFTGVILGGTAVVTPAIQTHLTIIINAI